MAAAVAPGVDGNTLALAIDASYPKTMYWNGTRYESGINTTRLADGTHTFTISAKHQNGQTYSTSITVQVANSSAPSPPPTPSPDPAPATNRAPSGRLDGIAQDLTITGWASDPDDPQAAVRVRIYVDRNDSGSVPVAIVPASATRTDVGSHGFSYQLPLGYCDGQSHTVWVFAVDLTDGSGAHDAQLSGSPLVATLNCSSSGAIVHTIALPPSASWCQDDLIRELLDRINSLRVQQGLAALPADSLGMKDAELRAVQFAQYMETHTATSPGFNPHEGYDATAASLGYAGAGENLAYLSITPAYIVNVVWQDPLHLAAMLARSANVAGVSCVYSAGVAYWTFEPGTARRRRPHRSRRRTPPIPRPPHPPRPRRHSIR